MCPVGQADICNMCIYIYICFFLFLFYIAQMIHEIVLGASAGTLKRQGRETWWWGFGRRDMCGGKGLGFGKR